MLHCSTTLASGRVWRRIIAPAFCAAAMLFKPRFFLDLGSEGDQQKPVIVAPVVATTEPTPVTPEATEPVYARAADPAAAAPVSSPTTAEAIAAELAAAQASRPAPSLATFAPDCITPGGALASRRRRGSADLGGFREMARGMMRS